MKVLITGIAGLFGTHFSKYLLDKGYNVYGIDNFFGGYREFIDERLIQERQFSNIDIRNDIENIFKYYKPDAVYHFAAFAAEGTSPFMRKFNYDVNVMGSANLINNAIKYNVKKFIFTSSMAVYGNSKPPFYETLKPYPVDPYGISKYAVELDLETAYNLFNLQYTIIRPHNVVGIYQNIWDRYRNVIGIWIRKVLNNEPITIFGDGEQIRSFSDIKYYMEPLEKVMINHNKEIFNIGAEKYYKLKDIAKIVSDVGKSLGYKPEIIHLEKRDEVKYAYCNHDKAKNILNFNDKTNIETLVHDMFLWAEKEPNRDVKKYNYEIDKNLYSYWK